MTEPKLAVAVWISPKAGPVVQAFADALDLHKVVASRNRGHVYLMHIAGEVVRRPTRWESGVSRLLATAGAVPLLRSIFLVSNLPDDLDSDLCALLVADSPAAREGAPLRWAESAAAALPDNASPLEVARVAMSALGPASAAEKRRLLEIVGLSTVDARLALKRLAGRKSVQD